MPAFLRVERRTCRCGVAIKGGQVACYHCRRTVLRKTTRAKQRGVREAKQPAPSPFALLYRDAKNDTARLARFAAEQKRIAAAVARVEASGLAPLTVGRFGPDIGDEQTYMGVGVWRGQTRKVLHGRFA